MLLLLLLLSELTHSVNNSSNVESLFKTFDNAVKCTTDDGKYILQIFLY